MAIQQFTLTDPDGAGDVVFRIDNNQSAVNEQWGLNDTRITVKYQVPWQSRFLARDLLLGTVDRAVATVGLVAKPYLRRTLPHKWIEGETSKAPELYCSQITNTEGLDVKQEPGCYATARITAVYSHLPYLLASDALIAPAGFPDESTFDTSKGMFVRFIERNPPTSEGRLLQSFGAGYVYCDTAGTTPQNGRPVMNGTPFPYFEETMPFTWHLVPESYAPWTFISDSLNKINSATFMGKPARTLMFLGCEPTFIRMSNGDRAWNLKYKFKYNRYGWDKLPDPLAPRPSGTVQWFRVVQRGGTAADILFSEVDFADFFRPV